MTNRELHDALKAELSIPYEELIIKHPTIADLGTEFVDYTEDGVFTLKYPLKDTQKNGYHLLQGGYISSFFDNNYGLFVYVAADASPFSTVNMTMNFHKAVLNETKELFISTRVISAGKRIVCLEGEARDISGRLIATSQTNMINSAGAYLYK